MVDTKKAVKAAGAKPAVAKPAVAKPAVAKPAVAKPAVAKKPMTKKRALAKRAAAKKASSKEKKPALKEGERKPSRRNKRTNILTGSYKPIHTIKVCKQVFLGNLPSNVGVPEIVELLRRFRHKIDNVRLVKATGAGKKAVREEGKVVPRSRGAAFVRVNSVSTRDSLLKLKNLSLGGKKIRVEKAQVKKAHVAKMAAQKKLKKDNFLKQKEALAAKKQTMAENRLKNLKHEKNVKKREHRKKSNSKSSGPKPLTEAAKRKMSKIRVPKQERGKLSGQKAQKARARMSRY